MILFTTMQGAESSALVHHTMTILFSLDVAELSIKLMLQTVSSKSFVGEQYRADEGILHLTPAHNSHQRLAGSSSYEAKSLKGPRYSSQPLLCQSQFAEIFYQCCRPLTS